MYNSVTFYLSIFLTFNYVLSHTYRIETTRCCFSTFEDDSAISALRFSPARISIAREENSAQRKHRCDCDAKYLHALNHEVQITARFFSLSEVSVKIRSKCLENFAMWFNVDSRLFHMEFSDSTYLCKRSLNI